jgi:hypothetical protein
VGNGGGPVDGDAEAAGAEGVEGIELGAGRPVGGAARVPQPTGARTAIRTRMARDNRVG